MNSDVIDAKILLLFAQAALVCCYTGQRYEIVIYQQEAKPSYNTSLQCYYCHNGDKTGCMTMANLSLIPIQTCSQQEKYCKVRRLDYYGKLLTFDRHCSSFCEPGCREGAYYTECVSCCNSESFCNIGNMAPQNLPRTMTEVIGFLLISVLVATQG